MGKRTVIAPGCRVFNSWGHSTVALFATFVLCSLSPGLLRVLAPYPKTPSLSAGRMAGCVLLCISYVCMPTMSRMRLSVTLTKRMQQLNLLWGACGTVGGDMAVWRCCSCSCSYWVRAVCKFVADNFLLALFRLWFHCVPASFIVRVFVCAFVLVDKFSILQLTQVMLCLCVSLSVSAF